jgi:hypothetical protein
MAKKKSSPKKEEPEFKAPSPVEWAMFEKSMQQEFKDKEREFQRMADQHKYIDSNFDYLPFNLFQTYIKAYFPTQRGQEYLKFLIESRIKYGDAAYYFCTWGGSPALESKCDECRKIVAFLNAELGKPVEEIKPLIIQQAAIETKKVKYWVGEERVKQQLFNLLTQKGAVESSSTPDVFFNSPIVWLLEDSVLIYLIEKLQEARLLRKSRSLANSIITDNFQKNGNTPFNKNSLSAARSRGANPKEGKSIVDQILKELLTDKKS